MSNQHSQTRRPTASSRTRALLLGTVIAMALVVPGCTEWNWRPYDPGPCHILERWEEPGIWEDFPEENSVPGYEISASSFLKKARWSQGKEIVALSVSPENQTSFSYDTETGQGPSNPYVANIVNRTFDDLGLGVPSLGDWTFEHRTYC